MKHDHSPGENIPENYDGTWSFLHPSKTRNIYKTPVCLGSVLVFAGVCINIKFRSEHGMIIFGGITTRFRVLFPSWVANPLIHHANKWRDGFWGCPLYENKNSEVFEKKVRSAWKITPTFAIYIWTLFFSGSFSVAHKGRWHFKINSVSVSAPRNLGEAFLHLVPFLPALFFQTAGFLGKQIHH